MTSAQPPSGTGRSHVETWLRLDPRAKPKIYAQVLASSEMESPTYWLEIIFSAGIATFGLVQNSPAVIIGAMLISPLMGPIMAMGLALAIGDLYLAARAMLNLVASLALAIGLSAWLVWLLPFHAATSEILARVNPNLLDLGIALLSGLAGSVVVCRGGGGDGVTALPGVAIAVALMPPLCTVGFGLGSGLNREIVSGAGLLFLTNLVAIVSTAFLVFLLAGMNSAEVAALMERSRTGNSPLQVLVRWPAARFVARGGQLRWRILMLLALLAAVGMPLRKALLQVANEAAARGAVQDVLKRLSPPGGMVSEQVRVGRDNIAIRLISTAHIDASKIARARQSIMRRTGRDVEVSVDEVASKSELTALLERISATPAAPPPPANLDQIQKRLMERIQPVLSTVWPSPEVSLQDFAVAFSPAGIVLNVKYEAAADLGEIPVNMITRSLQTALDEPGLRLVLERIPPPKPARKSPPRRKG